jgi:hypothetical protein
MRGRLVGLLLVLGLAAAVGLFSGLYFFGSGPAPRPPLQNTATVLQQIQSLSQLVTVKYVLQKVVILEDVKWYGESRVLLVAHGIVKAGVDLKRLEPDAIRLQGNRVIVTLPPAEITDSYLDDQQTRVIERTTGMLRVFDKDLEQDARRQAVEDIRRAARVNGILQDSDERARLQLKVLFNQLGMQVEFK